MEKSLVLLGLALVALVAGVVALSSTATVLTQRGLDADASGTSGYTSSTELLMLGGGALLIVAALGLAVVALVVLLRSRSSTPAAAATGDSPPARS